MRTCLGRAIRRSALIAVIAAAATDTAGLAARGDGSSRTPTVGDIGAKVAPRMILVEAFEKLKATRDLEAYRRDIEWRVSIESLCTLSEADEVDVRRAAVLALGVRGRIEANAAVARRLKDRDPSVRALATTSLWAIWTHADSPENNNSLARVSTLIELNKLDEAAEAATKLIERSPRFAEAYNQRAIAEYDAGRYEKSAEDCRKVLELNPYHIGALGGLAQCQTRLNQTAEAIRTYRRALELQPFSDDIRAVIARLEARD